MSPKDDPRAELAEIAGSLRAYLEMQVDTGAWGVPRGKMAKTAAAPASVSTPTTASLAPTPTSNPTSAASTPTSNSTPASTSPASTSAAPTPASPAPTSLSAAYARLPLLAAEVSTCTKCALHATRTQTVFSRGNPESKLTFIGEAPGADEDAQGIPFVGRAGQLLDKMISAMGLDPAKDVYVCNIIKCRPPGNRRPEPEETDSCLPYLHEQLAIVQPRVIVAMGNSAVQALLGTKLGITKVRGQWSLYKGAIAVMPTYHPSYLLRPSPQQADAKRQAWEDLQAVMKELGLALPKPKRAE